MRVWFIRIVVVAVIGALLATDIIPMFVSAQETIELAQQQQPRKRKTLMDMLFGPKEPEVVQQQAPAQPKAQQPVAKLPPAKPKIEKAANATRLAVFGDSLAVDLAKALDRFYAEDPNLAVIDFGVGSSGFVREDFFDWTKSAEEQVAANSFDLAVVIVGINDRQTMSDGGNSYKSLTPEWSTIYQTRLTRFLDVFRRAQKPVIWVGLPPMAKADYSTAISQISAIQRLASFAGGAEFVDIYDRFLGEDGKFASYGPDVNGQTVRMRKDDGIHFSSAGADKLAFYLNQTIRSFYSGSGMMIEVADPLLGTDAQTMVRPPFQGLGQIRLLEVAGAVISLSNAPARAVDLVSAISTEPPGPSFDVKQMLMAPVGRVDAFGAGVTGETHFTSGR